MLTSENLLLSACFLVLIHWGMRIGTPRHAWTSSESFVLGHWPFLFLNLLILRFTGGFDWTALERFDPSTLTTAQMVVALGLLSFLLGGLATVALQRTGGVKLLAMEASTGSTVRIALLLTIVGLAATIPNAIAMSLRGPEARSTMLLAMGELLVPGMLLSYIVMREGRFQVCLRLLMAVLFLTGLFTLAFNWSRRPIMVVVAGVLVLGFVRRRGYFDRRLFVVVGPALLLLAVGAFLWRNIFVHEQELYGVVGVVEYYAGALWLEASAFSALMWVVDSNGLLQVSGGGSLLLPLIFWIPRAIFPAKPLAFDPGRELGTPYSVGPSIYGEVLANVTVLGLVPFMVLLGFIFKWLDLSAARQRLTGTGSTLYVLLIFDALFLVRGSFHTMFTPIVLHVFAPLVLVAVDRWVVRLATTAWKALVEEMT